MSDKLVKCEISRVCMHREIGCVSTAAKENCYGKDISSALLKIETGVKEQSLHYLYILVFGSCACEVHTRVSKEVTFDSKYSAPAMSRTAQQLTRAGSKAL
jgi:hypothetical protein